MAPLVDGGEVIAEAAERPLALERQRRLDLVQRGAVLLEHRDVLAEAVSAGPVSPQSVLRAVFAGTPERVATAARPCDRLDGIAPRALFNTAIDDDDVRLTRIKCETVDHASLLTL